MVGPDRSLAVIRTTLDEVKAAAHAHDATVNDVMLALTAGGLRTVLPGRLLVVDEPGHGAGDVGIVGVMHVMSPRLVCVLAV
jgi:hypothetical protein